LYATQKSVLVPGRLLASVVPYLSLSGTSMAAPVVSGTVALMLQANPKLTPNLIKAILQYTAQRYPGYSALRQGAGFLNTLGAVQLAKYYASGAGTRMPAQGIWSRQIIWGNHRLAGGYLRPDANAWALNIVWGTAKTMGSSGDNIVWGTACSDCDNIVWGTMSGGDNIVWGTAFDGDNIVWGTMDGDNIVWGTDCGGADCDNVVWGTMDGGDNIVWGTANEGDNIVWGTSGGDNIVWATSDDAEQTMYDDSSTGTLPSIDLEFGIVTAPAVTSTTTTLIGALLGSGGF
jgi:hypothetical protein